MLVEASVLTLPNRLVIAIYLAATVKLDIAIGLRLKSGTAFSLVGRRLR